MFSALASGLFWLAINLGKVNRVISVIAKNTAGTLLGLMLLLIIAQVIFREFDNSLSWTEELSKFAMVWVACLVAPWAYRENLNVSIQMFADALPHPLRIVTEVIITLLVGLIASLFLIESIDFWQGGLAISASSVPVKLAVFYTCIPFAFAAILLVSIEKLLLQISGNAHFQTPIPPEPHIDGGNNVA